MKRYAFAFLVAAPSPVLAQSYPAGNVPPPPVSLDPGSAPATEAPVPAPAPAPAQPAVIVVGPDGKVQPQAGAAEGPSGRFVGGEGGKINPDDVDLVRGGPLPELHVVRRGDTLWDICFLYFNDPWQWPKVWSYNPQITNPHWIYPGDLVRLLPRGMFSQQPSLTPQAEQASADLVPPPQRSLQVGLKQTAFVEKADLDRAITLVAAVEEKELLGLGDEVYLRYPGKTPPKVGEQLSLYVPGKAVKDLGAYVRVLGTVEVRSVAQGKRARGVITAANQEIERGTKAGNLLKTFRNVPPVLPKVDAQGSVIAMLAYDQLIGDGELLFIDLGKQSGIEVGNRMYIVRRGDGRPALMSDQVGQDDRIFPARALGQVVIVEVGEKVSIALVTLSVQEMAIGDLVMMQKAK